MTQITKMDPFRPGEHSHLFVHEVSDKLATGALMETVMVMTFFISTNNHCPIEHRPSLVTGVHYPILFPRICTNYLL